MVLNQAMFDALARLVRVLHMTIGISEPSPSEERAIAAVWVVLFVLLVGVFVLGLFVIG
jgi:cytochrome b561